MADGGDGADRAAVEFFVEPFVEGEPGNHVRAAIEAVEEVGLDVELGPFSSLASGDLTTIADGVRGMIIQSLRHGATTIRLQVAPDVEQLSVGTLHDALDGMIRDAERELGATSGDWSRAQKQAVVRMLDERGAFLLRGAVDDIADVMGVSRITIYNYLNAIGGSRE